MTRTLTSILLAVLAAGFVSGCDPAPSTPLAPNKKMPDVSKMSKEQVDQMIRGNGPPSKR